MRLLIQYDERSHYDLNGNLKDFNKQLKLAAFICNGIGMKERHLMGIVRNGIMKRYKKSPEEVLKQMKSSATSGLGQLLEGIFGVEDIGARKRKAKRKARKIRNYAA